MKKKHVNIAHVISNTCTRNYGAFKKKGAKQLCFCPHPAKHRTSCYLFAIIHPKDEVELKCTLHIKNKKAQEI